MFLITKKKILVIFTLLFFSLVVAHLTYKNINSYYDLDGKIKRPLLEIHIKNDKNFNNSLSNIALPTEIAQIIRFKFASPDKLDKLCQIRNENIRSVEFFYHKASNFYYLKLMGKNKEKLHGCAQKILVFLKEVYKKKYEEFAKDYFLLTAQIKEKIFNLEKKINDIENEEIANSKKKIVQQLETNLVYQEIKLKRLNMKIKKIDQINYYENPTIYELKISYVNYLLICVFLGFLISSLVIIILDFRNIYKS